MPDLPRSLQIGYPHRLQHRNPTAHPVPESLRSQPPHTMPQQRRTFPPGHDRWSPAIRPPSESLLPAGCSHRLHPLPHTRPRHRRKGSSPPVPARSAKRFSDHRVFLSSDVRSLRPPQIENRRRIGAGLRTRQIARHQTPHVFRHGNAQFAGAFLHPTLSIGFKRDLRACLIIDAEGSLQAWLLTRLLLVCHAPFAKHFSLKVPR